MTTLVSACLLGFACRHDGGHRATQLAFDGEVVPICPEVAGGLGIPRAAAWLDGDRVVDSTGADVTVAFDRGSRLALEAARSFGATRAVLKQNSPSCGTRMTGTALGRAVGLGRTARLLLEHGLDVRGEDDLVRWGER